MLSLQLDGYHVPVKEPHGLAQKIRILWDTSAREEDHALLFDLRSSSEYGWHIHRVFSFFRARIHWLDEQFQVIKVDISKPFRFYGPPEKVYFVLETHPTIQFEVGQQIPLIRSR